MINGGEPTIHPRFADICNYLKDRFGRQGLPISLGTNLIPFAWSRGRYTNLKKTIFETFGRIEVGCDDEHRNIDALERFAPEIIAAGITLDVNVMPEYCSEETRKRILAVGDKFGIRVTFSELHHYYQSRPVLNEKNRPCSKRTQDLLINCNGDAFYCFHQEFERPLFNIFSTDKMEVSYYLKKYDPAPYRFCTCCPRYVAEIPTLKRWTKKGTGRVKRFISDMAG